MAFGNYQFFRQISIKGRNIDFDQGEIHQARMAAGAKILICDILPLNKNKSIISNNIMMLFNILNLERLFLSQNLNDAK